MKKTVCLLLVCATLLVGCGEAEKTSVETTVTELLTETATAVPTTNAETTAISVSTASELSDTAETTYQSKIETEHYVVDKIINFIKENRICNGCFYDFDKDGIPELVEAVAGIDDCTYNIYSLAYDEPEYIGMLLADSYSDVQYKLTLLKDNNEQDNPKYFYFAENNEEYIVEGKRTYMTNLLIYTFGDNAMNEKTIGSYSCKYEGEGDDRKIYISKANFMENEKEDGYYKKSEINTLLGVDKYLSQFEEIEEVKLEPLWKYDYDNDFENTVRNELMKYPDFIE